MEKLVAEVKDLIIETLNLEDVSADEIGDADPLFDEGLGLDSIDALEIGVAVKKAYGVELKGEDTDKHFASVSALAEFIDSRRA